VGPPPGAAGCSAPESARGSAAGASRRDRSRLALRHAGRRPDRCV